MDTETGRKYGGMKEAGQATTVSSWSYREIFQLWGVPTEISGVLDPKLGSLAQSNRTDKDAHRTSG